MKNSMFDQLEQKILLPAELQSQDIERALSSAMRPGVDFADLYFQRARAENWLMDDGIIKDGGYHLEQGVGVRACSGEKTGFAYSDDLSLKSLLEATSAASAVVKHGQQQQIDARKMINASPFYTDLDPILGMDTQTKLNLLREADAYARAADPRVTQVTVSLAGSLSIF